MNTNQFAIIKSLFALCPPMSFGVLGSALFSLPTNCEWCLQLSCGRACVTTSSLEVELCACLASNCIYGFFASLLSLFLLSLHLVAVPFSVFQSFACSLFSTCSFHISILWLLFGPVQMQRSPLLSCLLSFNFWLFSISFWVLNLGGIILIHLLLILRTLNHTAHTIHICHDISSCFNLFASCTLYVYVYLTAYVFQTNSFTVACASSSCFEHSKIIEYKKPKTRREKLMMFWVFDCASERE